MDSGRDGCAFDFRHNAQGAAVCAADQFYRSICSSAIAADATDGSHGAAALDASPSQTETAPSQTPHPGTQAAPDSSQTSASAGGAQSFSGTVVKSGDKYVLQDADSGKSYDIDHQEQVKQYEGKKVRVHGTLDANNKIHVQ